jgi:hypothetical protein
METTTTRNATSRHLWAPGRGLCLWCKKETELNARRTQYRRFCNNNHKCCGRYNQWLREKLAVDARA